MKKATRTYHKHPKPDCFYWRGSLSLLYTFPQKSTCSAEASVTVDRYFSLLQCKSHHLHHVQHCGEVGHSVVTPAVIIEKNLEHNMV